MNGLRKKKYSTGVYVHKIMKDNKRNQYGKTWHKEQEKKEEQDVQNTVTLKSGAKLCTRKCERFEEYE